MESAGTLAFGPVDRSTAPGLGPGAPGIRNFFAQISPDITLVRVSDFPCLVKACAYGGTFGGAMPFPLSFAGEGPGLAGWTCLFAGTRIASRALIKKPPGVSLGRRWQQLCVLQGVCPGRHESVAMARPVPRTCCELGGGPSGRQASLRMIAGAACLRPFRLAGILAQAVSTVAQGSSAF